MMTTPPSSRPRRRCAKRCRAAHWRSLAIFRESWRAHSRAASSSSSTSPCSVFTGASSPGSGFTGARPGSGFGLTKRGGGADEEARRPPSLMTMPALRVRRRAASPPRARLDAEQRWSAGGLGGRTRRGRRGGGAEPPWRPLPVASAVRRGARPRWGVRQRWVVAALDVRQHAVEGAAGDAPPEVAPLVVLQAADHRRPVGGR